MFCSFGSLEDKSFHEIHQSQNLLTSDWFSGLRKSSIALNFSLSALKPSSDTENPRNCTLCLPKAHFASFILTPCWLRQRRTSYTPDSHHVQISFFQIQRYRPNSFDNPCILSIQRFVEFLEKYRARYINRKEAVYIDKLRSRRKNWSGVLSSHVVQHGRTHL